MTHYKNAVVGLLLDAAACITLFFITGLKHEHSYLKHQDAQRYEWDTSLLDIVVLSVVRMTVGVWLWDRVRKPS